MERPAVVVVDLLEDTFATDHPNPMAARALSIVPRVNQLTGWARDHGFPVVFACDSFLPDDFLFGGKMKPHSLRGTPGAEPSRHLDRTADDTVLPKRRFSAFFKTDLDQTLRTWKVDTVIGCGLTSNFCVLTTVLDAVCHDFAAILAEDATTAATDQIHDNTVASYRRNAIYPLLRVLTCAEIFALVG